MAILQRFSVVALAVTLLRRFYSKDAEATPGLILPFVTVWLAQFVIWLIWGSFIYPNFVSPLRNLPTPGGQHWLMGHTMPFMAQNGRCARAWTEATANGGLIRYLWFLNGERLLLCSPKAISEVLVTKSYSFKKPNYVIWSLVRLLGRESVLIVEGEEHVTQRRILMPAFTFRHIKDLYPIFWEKSCESAKAMRASIGESKSAEMEINRWASRSTLDIIGSAGLGCEFGAIRDENNHLAKMYRLAFEASFSSPLLIIMRAFLPGPLVTMMPLELNKKFDAAAAEIRRVCMNLVHEKRVKLAEKSLDDVDILSVALEGGNFSDEVLIDQLMTFLVAGHETTSTSLTWAIYALAKNPDAQRRLRDEVRSKLPRINSETQISSSDIDSLPYLNAVCNEVLRLYSPVSQTVREAVHDTTILDIPIRKGTTILISPHATNASTALWGDDATEFRPERWITKGGAESGGDRFNNSGGASSNYSFLTFLHGPRSCIGLSFAKAELTCLLAAWISSFQFELRDKELADESKLKIKHGLTVKPGAGLDVIAVPVE